MFTINGLSNDPNEAYEQGRRDGASDANICMEQKEAIAALIKCWDGSKFIDLQKCSWSIGILSKHENNKHNRMYKAQCSFEKCPHTHPCDGCEYIGA